MDTRIALPIQEGRSTTFANQMGQDALVTADQAVDASYELAAQGRLVDLYASKKAQDDLSAMGAKPLTPEEANTRYPGLPTPFRAPVSPYVAQQIYDQHAEKADLERRVQNGPQDWWTKTKMFGAGIISHLMDPVEFGAQSLIGMGVGGLASRGVLGTSVAEGMAAVKAGTAGLATRTGINTLEAGAGNLVQNVAQEQYTSYVDGHTGVEYDPQEGLHTVIAGTLAGTLMGVGIKEGAQQIGGFLRRAVKETSPEADLLMARTQVAQIEKGLNVDTTPIIEQLATETSVRPEDFGNKFQYEHGPLNPDNPIYVVTKGSEVLHVGDNLGLGVSATDNPGVANANAVRPLADAHADVQVYKGKLNPIDLSASLPEEAKGAFSEAMTELGISKGAQEHMFAQVSGKEIIDTLWHGVDEGTITPEVFTRLKEGLSQLGYDSALTDGTKRLGYEHVPHNHLEIFDTSKLEHQGSVAPDPSVINSPSPELQDRAVKYSQGIENSSVVDKATMDRVLKAIEDEPYNPSDVEAKREAQTADTLQGLEELDKQGLLDSETKADIEEIKKLRLDRDLRDRLMVAVAGCVNG